MDNMIHKNSSYRKNKSFYLLAVTALFFVQPYLNDIGYIEHIIISGLLF